MQRRRLGLAYYNSNFIWRDSATWRKACGTPHAALQAAVIESTAAPKPPVVTNNVSQNIGNATRVSTPVAVAPPKPVVPRTSANAASGARAGGAGSSAVTQQRVVAPATATQPSAPTLNPAGLPVSNRITGYTNHGQAQVLGRDGGIGVANNALINAVHHPVTQPITQSSGSIKFIGQNAIAILNQHGQVITAWSTNYGGRR